MNPRENKCRYSLARGPICVLVLFMEPTPAAQRREDIAGLLAEKGLALACAVQQRALNAETPAQMAELSDSFVKVARCTRQCVALHAKLEKDRLSGERETAHVAAKVRAEAVAARKARLKREVTATLCDDW